MQIPIAVIDAFTDKAFSGNPAAVCLLYDTLTDEQMQAIAMEMNLSETAFVKGMEEQGVFSLRWFTPAVEIDLCGHATLASAFWMIQSGWADGLDLIRFQTRSGELRVKSAAGRLEMDFPLIPTFTDTHPHFSEELFGSKILQAAKLERNWIFELESEKAVRELQPDFPEVAKHSDLGFIVTAKGDGDYDIVSRFFGPNVGINEDPVTGFAHCALVDYWNQKTGKTQFKAFQASQRGGELWLEKHDDRVMISGKAVKVLVGTMDI
ncbi:PhzF family phenazine biosynthesis isomerase [Algoriphagus sp. H41]|uniref:PhzF family phenazine biosynthesis isomerase n=1 Tax=Algoriphagus oliviformis TaxID=2811231 RepID=A0ABS3C0R8_9BACT|nr:PhzF family phenazine biosynthesis isomerase [Algoriphagus oliviformis]MBN7810713.1 PhzF family phenazine biosynthesis isomerase [Algoriphagus oliviformis]